MYHLVEVEEIHIDSAITIEFSVEDDSSYYVLLLSHEHMPTHLAFEFGASVSYQTNSYNFSDNTKLTYNSDFDFFEWYINNAAVANRTGRFILTVATLVDGLSTGQLNNQSFAKAKVKDFVGNYKLRTFHGGCYYYNRIQRSWVADGVVVDRHDYGNSHCRASHLTSFAAGFFYTPNTIDFKFIYAEHTFTDNMTIYMIIIILLILYLLISIWARFEDMNDEKKLRSLACPDNKKQDRYVYEILTFTGPWEGASCDSRVQLEITGDNGSTGARDLDSGRKDTLRKGTVDSYILKTSRPLGSLNYIRIWHDNSGREQYGSWFLSAMIVLDVQTGQRTEFSVNRWLGVDKEDGAVERLIQASAARSCQSMLIHSASKHIKENHLWFSIFFRSHRSRYTRLQRTSTAFALLFLAMLVDAMWYGVTPEKVTSSGLDFEFLTFSPEQAYIGCIVTGVTTLPAILIMFMFKKSRRTFLRPNRINKALEKHGQTVKENFAEKVADDANNKAQESDDEESESSESSSESDSSSNESGNEDNEQESNDDEDDDDESDEITNEKSEESDEDSETDNKSDSSDESASNKDVEEKNQLELSLDQQHSEADIVDDLKENPETNSMEEERNSKIKTRSFTLPFFFRYIAWIICLGTIVTSIFFILAYGIAFGNDKTYQWLSSMIVSFFFAILVVEPLKVAFISCCISSLCKNVDLDADDDVEDDEKDPVLADESEWMGDPLKSRGPAQPIDDVKLDLIRIRRVKELEMWAIVKELSGFFFFFLITFLVNYLNRDPNSYLLQDQLRYNFITKNGFDKVKTSDDLWKWIHKTALPEMKASSWYNGQPPYGLRGFIGDKQSRMMGYGTLRQVRVKPNTCRVHSAVINLTQECAQGSIFVNEDDGDYCNAWEEKTPLTEFLPSCLRSEFKYTTAGQLNSMPYTAGIDSYGGGGYVYHIKGSSKSIRNDLKLLQQQRWINNHTRALFLEFSVYNANVNLFGIATIVAEFIPGGGIMPFWRFDPVRLLHYHEPVGGFILLCEMLFVCYILYFTYKFILEVKRKGCSYFDYWSIADMTIIFGSFCSFAIYGYR